MNLDELLCALESPIVIPVSGNWRITFRFDGEDVIVVNLEDYH